MIYIMKIGEKTKKNLPLNMLLTAMKIIPTIPKVIMTILNYIYCYAVTILAILINPAHFLG